MNAATLTSTMDAVMVTRALKGESNGLTCAQITAQTRLRQDAVRTAVDTLKAEGRVKCLGLGAGCQKLWRLTR